ncbi:hypothetical protein BC834DRAFT_848716 [Gloeopeniophorella convolvens]|nr:hypothetical protein BC834DRAFT_848716 [Gloeopeniophorella convolvens]
MLIVIDIEELEQFEGLPQTHQQVIQCASRIESALEHRQNGTLAPDAVLTYHIKQELLAIAAMVERDETIWPHPLTSTLGLMFSKNPSSTLDSVNINAVYNQCHKHQDKGVLATSNLSVYLETGPAHMDQDQLYHLWNGLTAESPYNSWTADVADRTVFTYQS